MKSDEFYKDKLWEVIIKELKDIRESIENLKTNHIAHLNQRIDLVDERIRKIENKIAYWGGGIASGIAIIEIVFKILNR